MNMIGTNNKCLNPLAILLLIIFLAHTCFSFHTTFYNYLLPETRSIIVQHSSRSSQRAHFSRRRTSCSSSPSSVEVYNNVIDDETCRRLHVLSLEHTRRSHDGSSLFRRGDKSSSSSSFGVGGDEQKYKLTPIETAIDRILTALNDTSPMVEYWSRSSYINMDAHADIDEDTLKEEGVLRCPRNGHVLYMQISNKGDNDRMGPTVVFPGRKVAWGSVSPRTLPSVNTASYNFEENLEERVALEYVVDVENYWDEEQRRQYGYEKEEDEGGSCEGETMAIVPALNGRLLRFDGAAFHSVPKPPDRYLMSERELSKFLENERRDEEDCDDDDDDDGYWDDEFDEYDDTDREDEDDSVNNAKQRSVLLFNTWSEGSSGPRGVLADRIVDVVPDGIVIEEESPDNAGHDSSREDRQRQQWQNAYGEEFEKVWCNPSVEWVSENIEDRIGDTLRNKVTIPLMGNPARRGVADTRDVLKGNVTCDSFLDGHLVSLVKLEKGND